MSRLVAVALLLAAACAPRDPGPDGTGGPRPTGAGRDALPADKPADSPPDAPGKGPSPKAPARPTPQDLSKKTADELIGLLKDPDELTRVTAIRELVDRKQTTAVAPLTALSRGEPSR